MIASSVSAVLEQNVVMKMRTRCLTHDGKDPWFFRVETGVVVIISSSGASSISLNHETEKYDLTTLSRAEADEDVIHLLRFEA